MQEPRVAYENSPLLRALRQHAHLREHPALREPRDARRACSCRRRSPRPSSTTSSREISEAGTGVIPGYPYPTVNPTRGTRAPRPLQRPRPRWRSRPTVKDALDKDPRWERTFDLAALRDLPAEERRPELRARAALPAGAGGDDAAPLEEGLPSLVRERRGARRPDRRSQQRAGGRARALPAHQPVADRAAARADRRRLPDRRAHLDHSRSSSPPPARACRTGSPMSYYPELARRGRDARLPREPGVHARDPGRAARPADVPPDRHRLDRHRWRASSGSASSSSRIPRPRLRALGARDAAPDARRSPGSSRARRSSSSRAAAWNFAHVQGPPYFYKKGWKAFEKQEYQARHPLLRARHVPRRRHAPGGRRRRSSAPRATCACSSRGTPSAATAT